MGDKKDGKEDDSWLLCCKSGTPSPTENNVAKCIG